MRRAIDKLRYSAGMEPIAEASAPHWAEITTEPQCPLCEYMLRGLNVARCPECGFRFAWSEVLDASRREHPYLFEQHPDRNLWSYFKTLFGAMRPRRFWSKLHPAQVGSPRRLLRFWLAGFLIFTFTLVVMPVLGNVVIALTPGYRPYGRHFAQAQQSLWEQVIDAVAEILSSRHFWGPLSLVAFVVGLWPWLTYLVLQIFQASMVKAKVRQVHVLRCVVYGLDLGFVGLVCAFVFLSSLAVFLCRNYFRLFWRFDEEWFFFTGIALVVLLHTDRLAVAYRRYLRFDHPRSVAISAQLITFLTLVTAYFVISQM